MRPKPLLFPICVARAEPRIARSAERDMTRSASGATTASRNTAQDHLRRFSAVLSPPSHPPITGPPEASQRSQRSLEE